MSNTKRARKLRAWSRYVRHYDRHVRHQPRAAGLLHPMRVTPGFFRAEGWDTRGIHRLLRHGA